MRCSGLHEKEYHLYYKIKMYLLVVVTAAAVLF